MKVNKKESLDGSTHSQQSDFIINETGNVINYAELWIIDNDDNKN